jgi:feruloyl esterase
MEAQRFPNDYDGIAAGAPTNNWNNMMFGRMWVAQATLKDPASYIPPAKYPAIHKAVMEACDALDGVKDGVLEDPTRCHFDPGAIECKGADGPDCLTSPQVEAARKIYTPARNPRTGEAIFPAMEPGSELVWATLAGGPKPIALADDYFKYVVFENPNWDFKTLNFDSDFAKAERRDGGILSATNPDLRPFFSHGGKLIQYHGWTDQQVMPRNSIDYYNSVVKEIGDAAKTGDSYRLFMAPGMGHCGGGEGPNKFDMVGALAQWVEKGKAPDAILASRNEGNASRTRPLCLTRRWPCTGARAARTMRRISPAKRRRAGLRNRLRGARRAGPWALEYGRRQNCARSNFGLARGCNFPDGRFQGASGRPHFHEMAIRLSESFRFTFRRCRCCVACSYCQPYGLRQDASGARAN